MRNSTLLKTGIGCTCVSAICCFTPALVILAGALGFTALVGYLDIIVIPALIGSLAVTGFALIKRRREQVRERAGAEARGDGA